MKVFLITKLRTTNVGNQALSEEIIKLFTSEVDKTSLFVSGRPMGLDGYTRSRIESSSNPVGLFEEWVDKIVKYFAQNKGEQTHFYPQIPRVELIGLNQPKLRFESIKARLRPVKRFFSAFKTYNKPYHKRLGIISSCDWLIYSGAGEVGDNNVFLRQLLELRIAQKLGKKTAAVNQSVVIKTETYKRLVAHVYGGLDKIVVRGEVSRKNLISYGVRSSIFTVAPDTALNTYIPGKTLNADFESSSKPLVGINFTPHVNLNIHTLERIVQRIRAAGNDLVFITNEPYEDRNIADLFMRKFQVPSLSRIYNYDEYAQLLGNLKYLISTRLHSNILSLVAKTPIIPIEGNVFKTTELLKQLEYPVDVIDTKKDNWLENVLDEINYFEADYYDWKKYFEAVLPLHIARVSENAAWLTKTATDKGA